MASSITISPWRGFLDRLSLPFNASFPKEGNRNLCRSTSAESSESISLSSFVSIVCSCSSETFARKEASSGTCMRYRVWVIRESDISRWVWLGRASCGDSATCGTTWRSTTSSMRSARALITLGDFVSSASPNKRERLS